MHHLIVKRAAIIVTILLIMDIVIFAWLTQS
jgi:hypothetical protein